MTKQIWTAEFQAFVTLIAPRGAQHIGETKFQRIRFRDAGKPVSGK